MRIPCQVVKKKGICHEKFECVKQWGMERGLSRLFSLMSASWVFIAAGCDKPQQKGDPTEEVDKMVFEEVSGGATDHTLD